MRVAAAEAIKPDGIFDAPYRRPDYDGIVAGFVKGTDVSKLPTRSTSGISIEYVEGTAPVATAASRADDDVPWHEGGRLSLPYKYQCTAGWPATKNGDTFMITANHCFVGNGKEVRDGTKNQHFGTTQDSVASTDSTFVHVLDHSKYMFDGGLAGTSGEKLVGYKSPTIGLYICTSGSFTTTHCDISIHDSSYPYKVDGVSIQGGVLAYRGSTQIIAVGQGDSGGPVLTNTATAGEVKAAGMISAGRVELPCPTFTLTYTEGGKCFNGVIFVDLDNILVNGFNLYY